MNIDGNQSPIAWGVAVAMCIFINSNSTPSYFGLYLEYVDQEGCVSTRSGRGNVDCPWIYFFEVI